MSDLEVIKEIEKQIGRKVISYRTNDDNRVVELRITNVRFSEFDIINADFSDISPLKELNKLNYLNLSYIQISDISPLKELKQLTSLVLYENKISDIFAYIAYTI